MKPSFPCRPTPPNPGSRTTREPGLLAVAPPPWGLGNGLRELWACVPLCFPAVSQVPRALSLCYIWLGCPGLPAGAPSTPLHSPPCQLVWGTLCSLETSLQDRISRPGIVHVWAEFLVVGQPGPCGVLSSTLASTCSCREHPGLQGCLVVTHSPSQSPP